MPALHHIAIKVEKIDALAGFYEKLLDLKRLENPPVPGRKERSIWLAAGRVILMLEEIRQPVSRDLTSGYHLIAFSIRASERNKWTLRLAERGVPIEKETAYSIFFRDPEGNRLALSHYPEAA